MRESSGSNGLKYCHTFSFDNKNKFFAIKKRRCNRAKQQKRDLSVALYRD